MFFMSYNRINLFLRIDFFNIDIENIYAILVYKKYKKREQCSLLFIYKQWLSILNEKVVRNDSQ